MFDPGNILYIPDYEFPNRIRDKYLVVLCNINGVAIVSSFTTSQQYVNDTDVRDGIIKTQNKHCFCFLKSRPIGTNGFSFRKTTFILPFRNVSTLSINKL